MRSNPLPPNVTRLIEALDGGLVVLTAYSQLQLSADMPAPFVQEANFWWLSCIEQPGWKLAIDGARGKITLVRPKLTQAQVVFEGGLSDDRALKLSGAHEVIAAEEFEAFLRQAHRSHSMVHTLKLHNEYDFVVNPAQHELCAVLERIFDAVQDCARPLAQLRAMKTPSEIAAIKKAIKLTTTTFAQVREGFDSYSHECEIEADFTRSFRRHNAHHAYEPIVASGKNALTLHYTANSHKLAKSQLVLIDVGARVDGYCADITRTYCARPTKRQLQVHGAVERAHARIIALIRPGLAVGAYAAAVDEIMKDALMEVGLLEDRSDDTTYRNYFPHAVSHGLGVDVHDGLGSPHELRAGMVITVEPGIYIAEEGIGIRIEDDILVTETGHRNLSGSLSTKL
ncbi:MAG TPA: aminopeptidase P N-terminal domain-containing protein [Candidatus Saccharimonas sp.]|jgi:Xaa-Pro aminopeptidase|nr:aminopeptidase P N-terminal domain-containing protein [Candidatus Saccharimonas sp.]